MGVLKDSNYQIPWLGLGRTFNPNLDTGTEGIGTWRELHDALRDPKAAACLDLRCQVVADLPWTLIPQPGTSIRALDLVRKALEGLNLVEDIEEMAKAAYYGLVPLEVHWDTVKGDLVPVDLESFEPIHLSFDPDRQPMVGGQVAEVGKLILHRQGSHFRNPWGLGRGRTIPRWVRVKVAVAYATYRDYPRYAHDRMVFRYPDGTQDEEQNRYIQIANRLMDSPGVVIPDGMTCEPIKLDSKFEMGVKLLDAANAEIATGILGNTLTTSEGRHGTQALGGVHQEQSDRQESADARRIEATLNRTLIPWIVFLNLGPDEVPPLFHLEKQVKASLKDRIASVLSLRKEGLEPSVIWLRETFGIPEPQNEEDTLEPKAPEVAPPNPERLKGLPETKPEPTQAELADAGLDPTDAMLARWADGYIRRMGVVAQLLAQGLREAQDFGHAWQSALAVAKDFPVSAGEALFTAMKAARDLGAFEAHQEAQELNLADGPAIDYGMVPDQALAWLLGKVPMTFNQVEGLKDAELRARAFWVAGVDQINLLTDLQQSMGDALAAGTPFDEWKNLWLDRLAGAGVTEERLRLAFDTQVHAAYMGGRLTSLQSNPLVQNITYVTAGDERVRPGHRILDGVTRPKLDPFWSTHTPPLGFRCRCRIRAAEAGRKVTESHDPRLRTPPEAGFGQGAPSFARYLDSQAREAMTWKPIPTGNPAWSWLDRVLPSPMTSAPTPLRTLPIEGLVTDPTGRVVAAPAATQPVLDALQAPAEIWLGPVEGPEGQLGLQLNYLLPLPNDQVLLVPAQGGVVPRAQGPQVLSDPAPWRRGVRLL
jgi:SPP1 gp7 family putative phage head morphogenesis protein